jgi:conjugative relaxase-like TrwC/TraI family protein
MQPDDLRMEWLGRGAGMLGLKGPPDYEQFKRLIHGLDPWSGEQLTAKILENRIPGWDVNVHCPKGVTTVIEHGDGRVQDALWEAARETVADLERVATTRIRKGGKQDDRVTGNLVGYAVEHAETRPVKSDKMPDPHRHIHMVLFNLTYDKVEGEWKAVKFRPVMDLRKYFDRRFNQRFSNKLAELGYEIETHWKRGPKGERKYMGWDVSGVPATVLRKFSRRSQEIDKLADELGVTSIVARDKLGATSRLNKRDDLTLGDCRQYWHSRVTPEEGRQIDNTISQAERGINPRLEPAAEMAMSYAIDHHFERQSVVPLKTLEISAMERSMGAGLPQDVERAVRRQGLLVRDGLATTKEVLAEEQRVIGFAREGRGAWKPLGPVVPTEVHGFALLSAEQQAAARHVWQSPDRVMLIRGGAGTGKTRAMTEAVAGIEQPVVVLAPSADASRDVLRRAGFAEADTIAHFLQDDTFREKARDGVIWIDETGLTGMRQLDQVFAVARELGARVVLQGDSKQHKSVERGSPLQVLEQLGGLPVARLTDIRRQDGRYKEAVAAIDRGDILAGHDILTGLGWVKQTGPFDHNHPLVDDYLAAIDAGKSVMIIAPTHREGDEITGVIRSRLKEQGVVGSDDRLFAALKPLHWTEAERGDLDRYAGTEIVQFHRHSGPFKAGERVDAATLVAAGNKVNTRHFAVYGPDEIRLAAGDALRITANGKSKDGKHKVNNGAMYRVDGFTPGGNIRLSNGWILDKEFSHLSYAYTGTSYASQGKTFDRILIAMGHESAPAINAEQFYVSVSRGREMARIYSNMAPAVLREHIRRSDPRMSAHELLGRHRPGRLREWPLQFARKVRERFSQLRDKAEEAVRYMIHQHEARHGR